MHWSADRAPPRHPPPHCPPPGHHLTTGYWVPPSTPRQSRDPVDQGHLERVAPPEGGTSRGRIPSFDPINYFSLHDRESSTATTRLYLSGVAPRLGGVLCGTAQTTKAPTRGQELAQQRHPQMRPRHLGPLPHSSGHSSALERHTRVWHLVVLVAGKRGGSSNPSTSLIAPPLLAAPLLAASLLPTVTRCQCLRRSFRPCALGRPAVQPLAPSLYSEAPILPYVRSSVKLCCILSYRSRSQAHAGGPTRCGWCALACSH